MNPVEENRHHIEAALEYSGGTHNFDDVRAGIESGHMQLWATKNAAAVTEILKYARKKTLNVFLAAGDMDEIVQNIDGIADWGRLQGCDSLTINGRSGWTRVLGRHGFKPVAVTLERDL
jgi:hypothetical protein